MEPAGKNQIVERYTGATSFDRILMTDIDSVSKSLVSRYSKHQFYENLSARDKHLIEIRCMPINAEKAFYVIGICASVGTGVGAIVGAILANAPGAAIGAGVGFVSGAAVGVGVVWEEGILHEVDQDILNVSIKQNPSYKVFKETKTKEQYSLYMNFISNYSDFLTREEDEELKSIICPITQWIPEFPVFSPYDLKFQYPFDKNAIEELMEIRQDIGRCVPPFSGNHFSKRQLVYNVAFSKKVIRVLKTIQNSMQQRITAKDDPILQEAIKNLILNYQENYQEATTAIIDRLSQDAFRLGKSYSQTKEVCELFALNFQKV